MLLYPPRLLAIVFIFMACATSPTPIARPPLKAQAEMLPHAGHNDALETDDHIRHQSLVHCKLRNFDDECPPPLTGGAWEGVIPSPGSAAIHNILGMQTVHATMLPSGRLLLISGSSWRNRNGTQYYPEFENPETPTGLFIKAEDPFRNEMLDEYYELVNNAAIYDPITNDFFRIPVPIPETDPQSPNHFAPNDFFCTGHQHLPDGNVLFVGGTQYYNPFRTGHRSSYVFDWRRELSRSWRDVDWRVRPQSNTTTPWTFAGFMKRGRWYPSLLPLLDGRLAIFSGFVGFDPGFPEMYVFEINSWIEVFDATKFDPQRPQLAWKAVDAAKAEGSPFKTKIRSEFTPTHEVECNDRCRTSNLYDAFKLYPQNYLQKDGRIYLTREGDWVSLRTCDAAFMRDTKYTYWCKLEDEADRLKVSFERGPDRVENVTSYGTTFLDPHTGQIQLIGGQPNSPGTLYPLNASRPTQFAGGRGSTRLETFTPDPNVATGGSWTLDAKFLGTGSEDDRTMHYTVALPTGQILVLNGGNYDFYGPVFSPILLTPNYDAKSGKRVDYSQETMLDALEPRLYHNVAILLPDARVFVSGGNSARATVTPSDRSLKAHTGIGQPHPNLDLVENDLYFFDDGPIGKGLPGQLTMPTENWTAEIFSPPYLFIDGQRRAKVKSLAPTESVDYTANSTIHGKPFTLFHSGVRYEMGLTDLPTSCDEATSDRLVLIKLPSATHGWQNGQHFVEIPFESKQGGIQFTTPNAKEQLIPPGYYMLFYTDCRGKPAKARMVRFDDKATAA